MGNGPLPGVDDRDHDRVIAHVDMDCFYAACERRREPALRGEPVVVGMGFRPGETGGVVATASYEAREYGVESAQPIETALERLPRKVDAAKADDVAVDDAGFYRPVDMEYYETVGQSVRRVLEDDADTLRRVSIDEAYLDVADRVAWSDVRAWASDLKDRIAAEVGVSASVGVAPTMSAAKVASDHDKPDGLVVVEPGTVQDFFADLPVEDVHGVGPVTATELAEVGVETAGDLAAADPGTLADRFGDRGRAIRRYARGEDDRDVEPRGRPKSLSRESAFGEATDDPTVQRERLLTLAEAVVERAASKGALYRTIGVKVVTPPFDVNTRERSLPGPLADGEVVENVARELFDPFAGDRVRKVGVRVSNLSFPDGEQSNLGGFEDASVGEGDADEAGDGSADGGDAATDSVDSGEAVTGTADGGDGSDSATEDDLPPSQDPAGSATPDGQTSLEMVATGADETDGRVDGDADDADDATGANDAADVSDAPAPELWGQTTLWDFGVFDPE